MRRNPRIALIGPTSAPWIEIEPDVAPHLARLPLLGTVVNI